ncbi:MAG: hypothetical protein JRJ87_14485 [Deltaproteobacteria bacterium]|nr:hypothetical protein [Deltaproteobacteria bacterium]
MRKGVSYGECPIALCLPIALFMVIAGCSEDVNHCCWEEMEIRGDSYVELEDIWGTSASNFYAVGRDTRIVHCDNFTCTTEDIGVGGFVGIWGSSESDIYVISRTGQIMHYDGNEWSKVFDAIEEQDHLRLEGIWGSSESDVYAVGSHFVGPDYNDRISKILHFDGASWVRVENNFKTGLTSVWGSSSTDVFAIGAMEVYHYDGNEWCLMMGDAPEELTDVWGTSANDVYAIGSKETVVHYNGVEWSEMNVDFGSSSFRNTWGTSSDNIYVSGSYGGYGGVDVSHFDGNSWIHLDLNFGGFNSVWGSSPDEVFMCGCKDTVAGCEEGIIVRKTCDVEKMRVCNQ